MNILYHHRTQGKGVEAVHIRGIVDALRRRGHHVTVFSPPGCDPFQKIDTSTKKTSNIFSKFFSWISRRCPELLFESFELIYNVYSFFAIRKLLKPLKIDCIYERYFLFSAASLRLAKSRHIPICYEINDSSFLPRLRQLKLVKVANRLEQRVFSKADFLVTVTNYFKEQLIKSGIPGKKLIVAPNGVDLTIFNPEKTPKTDIRIPNNTVALGFVGLFVQWSGLSSLVDTFYHIHQNFPQTHLILVGGGPLEDEIRGKITDLGLTAQVTFTGKLPHQQVPAWINAMDICIIREHERYTSPVKLFEYMAMGKAVIVPDYMSIQEIIQHRVNGMLFNPDQTGDLEQKLVDLLENPILRKQIGVKARRDVLKNYTWDHNAQVIEEEFQKAHKPPPFLSNGMVKDEQDIVHKG